MYTTGYLVTYNSQICNHLKSFTSGGREKKTAKKRGRPSDSDRATTIMSVKEVQPSSFYPPGLPPQYSGVHSSLKCCVCLEVLNRPVLLPCNELVCGPCCSQWVAVSGGVSCPCCHGCCMDTEGVRKPPSAVMYMLGGLTPSCKECQQPVQAAQYLRHLKSKCGTDVLAASPSTLTVADILATPTITPPTAIEKKAAGKILKRLMLQDSTATIKVPTSGQVCIKQNRQTGTCTLYPHNFVQCAHSHSP